MIKQSANVDVLFIDILASALGSTATPVVGGALLVAVVWWTITLKAVRDA